MNVTNIGYEGVDWI